MRMRMRMHMHMHMRMYMRMCMWGEEGGEIAHLHVTVTLL